MNPTAEQQAVVDLDLEPGEAAKVSAYAGTGKTSTLIAYAAAHPGDRTLYLAFNKAVADESKRKFGVNVTVKTVHALAYQHVGRKFTLGTLQQFKVSKLIRCDVYVGTLICHTLENWWNSASPKIGVDHAPPDVHSRLPVGYQHELVRAANIVWKAMLDQKEDWPMTHAGYLKLFQLENRNLGYDTVLVDEAQDTNEVTQAIVETQRKNGARVIWTGDRFQQIYSWRGAVNAMDLMKGTELFLTQSFRFGVPVANLATMLLDAFFDVVHPVVGLKSFDTQIGQVDAKKPHTVLTRTNKGVFRVAYQNVLQGVPTSAGGVTFDQFLDTLLDVYLIFVGRAHECKTPSLRWFKSWSQFNEYVKSRLDAEMWGKIELVNEMGQQIPVAIERIKGALVNESLATVNVLTAHRAKGLEWDQVVLHDDFTELLDSDGETLVTLGDRNDPETETVHPDEIHLVYVALTRAKRRLAINPALFGFLRWLARSREASGLNVNAEKPDTGYAPEPVSDEIPFELSAVEKDEVRRGLEADDDSALLG